MGRVLSIDSWTGDFLAERGLVTPKQLNDASELAVSCGANLADVMLTKNWIAEDEYYTALAERFSVVAAVSSACTHCRSSSLIIMC